MIRFGQPATAIAAFAILHIRTTGSTDWHVTIEPGAIRRFREHYDVGILRVSPARHR
ncbi:hypothetical protein Q0Z83_063130 [Actinoplanes sichuanensis]|nr:hypothetical protein Q0Z83_063130 [Actinoplanes sichuanensis]